MATDSKTRNALFLPRAQLTSSPRYTNTGDRERAVCPLVWSAAAHGPGSCRRRAGQSP